MLDAIQEIRVRAEVLHQRALTLDANTLRSFRRLPHFDPTDIRRHECFTVLASEMGFPSWPHAKRVLSGLNTTDFGTLLCPNKCGGHLNLWYKAHEEAATVRERRGGWLLAYRSQFLVVDRYYVETLGLDPQDPDWIALGFDWARGRERQPEYVAARARLYGQLIAQLPRETAETMKG
jgi:hypothetical protein